jgi:broad specificity phosphatase PhoE
VLLYLITHAHTQQQAELDATTWRLSAQGQRQSDALALQPFWAQVSIIAVSSEVKTRLTVAPLLAQRTLPVIEDSRFDELRRGGWIGDYNERVAQALAAPEQAAGDWEPASSALRRVLEGIRALHITHPGETVALVGHGLTLSLYRSHLLGQQRVSLADWRALGFAAVALVDVGAGRLVSDFAATSADNQRGGPGETHLKPMRGTP